MIIAFIALGILCIGMLGLLCILVYIGETERRNRR